MIDKSDLLVRVKEAKYDRSCPHYRFLFQDLKASKKYDHYCLLERQVDANLLVGDFEFCNNEDHTNCPRFLARQKIISEREAMYEGSD